MGRLPLDHIRSVLESKADRAAKAESIAEVIRHAGGYRWVGIYEVAGDEIRIIAWSGPGEPTHPRFPVSQGLCGGAVRSRSTVVVGDVTKHPAYLTTFGSTRSEIVVPVTHPATGTVLGVIDVESERLDAFTDDDCVFLEACASALTALLWPPLAPGGLSPTPSATD